MLHRCRGAGGVHGGRGVTAVQGMKNKDANESLIWVCLLKELHWSASLLPSVAFTYSVWWNTWNGGWRLCVSASSFLWRLGCAGRSDGSTGVHPSVLVLGLLLRRLQDLQHANRAVLASTCLQWGDGTNHDTIGFLDSPRWTMINVKNYFFKLKNMKKSTFVWTSLSFSTAWTSCNFFSFQEKFSRLL